MYPAFTTFWETSLPVGADIALMGYSAASIEAQERATGQRAAATTVYLVIALAMMFVLLGFSHFTVQRLPLTARPITWVDLRLRSVDDLSGTETVSIDVLDVHRAAVWTDQYPWMRQNPWMEQSRTSPEYYFGETRDGAFVIHSNDPLPRGRQTITGILGKSLDTRDKFDGRLVPHTIDVDSWRLWSVYWVVPLLVAIPLTVVATLGTLRIARRPGKSRKMKAIRHQYANGLSVSVNQSPT